MLNCIYNNVVQLEDKMFDNKKKYGKWLLYHIKYVIQLFFLKICERKKRTLT